MSDIFYLCDPKKNKNCNKTSCYGLNMNPQYGECKYTRDKAYSKDGKLYSYNERTGKVERRNK